MLSSEQKDSDTGTQLMRSRSSWILLLSGLVVLAVSTFYVRSVVTRPHIQDRVYRIGWQNVPPFQYKAEDGSPAGLAVDLVRDAAQRSGIQLEWVWYPGSSEAALRNREVDLWPLITITPERQRISALHISKPYLQHDHDLLVRADSRFGQVHDVATASISYVEQPINRQLLGRVLPNARLVAMASQKEAIDSVCAGRADAVYLDEFTAGAALLSGVSCSSQPLRVIAMPMLRSELGVGATRDAGPVADAIRREIDTAVVNGELTRVLTKCGHYSQGNVQYMSALLNAQRRERWLLVIAGMFAVLLIIVGFEADRIRRHRNRIRMAAQALRESEQKLRLMADNLTEVVLAYDMDRRLVFVNPAFEKLTGYSVTDLNSDKSICWVHPDDRLRMHTHWDELFRGKSFSNKEYRLVTTDGRTRWMTASWGPVCDETGQQVGVQGSERDITDRKFAEDALRESELRFRELLENVQLVAIMTDPNGNVVFCNDYALALTGWSREEIMGRSASHFLDLAYAPGTVSETRSADRAQTFVEGTILEKNGGRRCIQWSSTPVRDSRGQSVGFASLGVDVTELRALRAKAAQLESEEQFRNVADVAPVLIWVTGPDKGISFVNKPWLAFTGRTLEQELGTGWTASVHPDDLDPILAAYTSAFDARRDFQLEYRKRRADGEYRWVLGSGVPRFGINGDFAGYIGTCTDISDLKRSRDEELVRQKLENVSRLASGVAHDFNNLLGVVLAQVDLALAGLTDGASPEQQLNNIRDMAIRGAVSVRQLIIYAGQETAVSELVDISGLVDKMRDLLKLVVSGHAVLKTELMRNMPAVRANPVELQQLVMNLVANGSDAIGNQDGVITIRTSVTIPGPDFGQSTSNTWVQLEISDTGCGISPDAQSKVFDPFFTTKLEGKGLGLTVVKRVVETLGGTIQLQTGPDRGTLVRVLLPAATETLSSACPTRIPGSNDEARNPGLILVVEDEAPLRTAITKILRMNSFTVLEAGDGNVALNLIREHRQSIGLLLLDITLPGVPSHEVFAEIRRLCPETKVVVSSAYGRQKADECFSGMEMDAFIRKPYRLADLVSLVRSLAATHVRGLQA